MSLDSLVVESVKPLILLGVPIKYKYSWFGKSDKWQIWRSRFIKFWRILLTITFTFYIIAPLKFLISKATKVQQFGQVFQVVSLAASWLIKMITLLFKLKDYEKLFDLIIALCQSNFV